MLQALFFPIVSFPCHKTPEALGTLMTRYHKPSRRRHQQEHPLATPPFVFSPSPSLPDKRYLSCPSNCRAMKFMATNRASSTSGRRSFLQLRDKPDDTDRPGMC